MSVTLLLVCRRSIGLASFSQLRPALLRPLRFSPITYAAESSTFKSKYASLNPSAPPDPFREPSDERSRRLKLQQHIRFREKFQLENDYELIFAIPRERMYSLMHLLCTCASVTMVVFVAMHLHRDMLGMEPFQDQVHQSVPPWILYTVATLIGSTFGIVLILISRIPARLYYSPVRQAYALFYHPVIGIFRQKKILFGNNQYQVVPQKLDSIESAERTIKIRIELGKGLFKTRESFYLIENYFRSRGDVNRMKSKKSEESATPNEDDKQRRQEESDIWETVVEKKDQPNTQQRSKTFFK